MSISPSSPPGQRAESPLPSLPPSSSTPPASEFPHLPDDIIGLVLQAVYDQGGQGSLQAALRVNLTFYFLAAPILYSHPKVADLLTFFLGADRPVPHHVLAMEPGTKSDLLHLQHGNTKLPLLRHLRRISTPNPKVAPTRPFTRTQVGRLEELGGTVQRILRSVHSDTALYTGGGFLPLFRSVVLDALPFVRPVEAATVDFIHTTDDVSRVNETVLPALLRAGPLAKSVCCSDAQDLPSGLEGDWLSGSRDTLPELLCWHIGPQQPFFVAWGSTTRVYVNFPIPDAGPGRPRGIDSLHWLVRAGDMLRGALKRPRVTWGWNDQEALKKIVEATKVEVYGLKEDLPYEMPLPELGDLDMGELSQDEQPDDDHKDTKGAREVLDRYLRRMEENLRDIPWGELLVRPQFELLRGDQAPPCPCCGKTPVMSYQPRPKEPDHDFQEYDSEGYYDSDEDPNYVYSANYFDSEADLNYVYDY